MQSQQSWHETYLGCSAEEERRIFARLTPDIQDVQLRNKKTSGASDTGPVRYRLRPAKLERARVGRASQTRIQGRGR
jgi:hypothetical protein